jgi:hypothetical protein
VPCSVFQEGSWDHCDVVAVVVVVVADDHAAVGVDACFACIASDQHWVAGSETFLVEATRIPCPCPHDPFHDLYHHGAHCVHVAVVGCTCTANDPHLLDVTSDQQRVTLHLLFRFAAPFQLQICPLTVPSSMPQRSLKLKEWLLGVKVVPVEVVLAVQVPCIPCRVVDYLQSGHYSDLQQMQVVCCCCGFC